jgi:DNA mismatch repair protein MutS2
LENEISGRFGPQWIIHGHGTGKLRDGVCEFLDSYPRKEKYEFADPTDGGKGVTIVF